MGVEGKLKDKTNDSLYKNANKTHFINSFSLTG
jgi:hypothetical protein